MDGVMFSAVIGTGTIGPQIAQVFAQSECMEKVYMCKGRDTSTHDGKKVVMNKWASLVSKGKITQEMMDGWAEKLIVGPKTIACDADILVEAVTEDLQVKKSIFREMDAICRPDCLFATNTSSLSIRAIGDGLSRPVIGMHFFNPVQIMKLVEVIAADNTPQQMIDQVLEVARLIGKNPVEVKESPGFVVNRLLIPMINEAISIYDEGISSAEDIDTAMRFGANHPMGPLALADLIGLDVVLSIMEIMLKDSGNPKYLPAPSLKRMVRENKLGRKTGEGFYRY